MKGSAIMNGFTVQDPKELSTTQLRKLLCQQRSALRWGRKTHQSLLVAIMEDATRKTDKELARRSRAATVARRLARAENRKVA